MLDRLNIRATLGYVAMIVGSGVAIVEITGLQGGLPPATALFWLGYEYAVGMLFVVWQGNRLLWRVEPALLRRFPTPFLKPILFALALGGFTAPLVLMLSLGWFWIAAWSVRWDIVQSLVVWNTLAVSVLTFFYETTVLAREREENLLQMEKLKRASIQAELEALKLQLDPHFLFNSLNTLSHLIETSPHDAAVFNDNLADVYRYVLTHRNKALVRLGDELALLKSYYTLLRLRFRGSIELRIESNANPEEYAIVPLALQLLLENAVKHNELSEERPLVVEIRIETDAVTISNTRRPKRVMKNSTHPGTGLQNLNERVQLISRQRVAIVETAERFVARIPVERLELGLSQTSQTRISAPLQG